MLFVSHKKKKKYMFEMWFKDSRVTLQYKHIASHAIVHRVMNDGIIYIIGLNYFNKMQK